LKFKAKNTGIASLYRVFLTKKFSFLFKIRVLFYIDLAIVLIFCILGLIFTGFG